MHAVRGALTVPTATVVALAVLALGCGTGRGVESEPALDPGTSATPLPTADCAPYLPPPQVALERGGRVVPGLPVSMTFDGCGRSGIFTADGFIAVPRDDGSGPFALTTVDGAQLTVTGAVSWSTAAADGTSWHAWRTDPTLAPRTLEPATSSGVLLVPAPPPGSWRISIEVAIDDRSTGMNWHGVELFGVTIAPPAEP